MDSGGAALKMQAIRYLIRSYVVTFKQLPERPNEYQNVRRLARRLDSEAGPRFRGDDRRN